jgi:molybdopterin molybdotransferase
MPPTPGGYAYASPADALAALLACLNPVGTELLALDLCPGRLLAEEIRMDRPSPPLDVSAMDGYAVRVSEVRAGTLPIGADARIGREPVTLPSASAARIVTGAPIPRGADTVIKREDLTEHSDRIEITADVAAALRRGVATRKQGENVSAGRSVLSAGVPIGAAQSGVLASVGAATPLVHRRVRAAILVTGDELLPVDSTPEAWQLRDSNGPALTSLFAGLPFTQTSVRRHAADDLQLTTDALRSAAGEADVVFVTGGVSMGDRDFVPAALRDLGARTLFHKLPQRPGKPILAAVLPSGAPVLALPGNPVSVLVTSRRIGVPVLRRLAGFADPLDTPRLITLENPDSKIADLWWQRPVRLTGAAAASLVTNMGSGDIMNVAASDGFIEVPPNQHGPGPWPMYPWRP